MYFFLYIFFFFLTFDETIFQKRLIGVKIRVILRAFIFLQKVFIYTKKYTVIIQLTVETFYKNFHLDFYSGGVDHVGRVSRGSLLKPPVAEFEPATVGLGTAVLSRSATTPLFALITKNGSSSSSSSSYNSNQLKS